MFGSDPGRPRAVLLFLTDRGPAGATGRVLRERKRTEGGSGVTEDELYRAYLAGEPEAGDRLMLRCADALTDYLTAFLHNVQDAEDLLYNGKKRLMICCVW